MSDEKPTWTTSPMWEIKFRATGRYDGYDAEFIIVPVPAWLAPTRAEALAWARGYAAAKRMPIITTDVAVREPAASSTT